MVKNNIAPYARMRFPQDVSRFARAYDAALKSAGLTKSEAATIAGIHQSTVSRILTDDIAASADILERLLGAIPNEADRRHCVREFLFDQTPRELRDELIVHFGTVDEDRPAHTDKLGAALQVLEQVATEDPDLKKLIIDWAHYVRPTPKKRMTALAEAEEEKLSQAELRKAERAQSLLEQKQSAVRSSAERAHE